ncbi:NAD(P)-binding protein [Fusarium pseudocircinatum]|uniref:NAD(P)-binding protein n=1 Tax=Fusarium pseudocircinatum TaxID=56676 RepID=A0A8H5PKJ4_9HYPO|nr:NAD(P)-binding protein [Fusarium pseudocircinatum]
MSFFPPIRVSNALITQANAPKIAVFVGGTDGIGKATLTNLVARGFPIKVYIVGRNKAGHQTVLDHLRTLNPNATLIYVEGQISLVRDSQRIASHIAAQEEKIDLLFLSAGYLPFTGRQETRKV